MSYSPKVVFIHGAGGSARHWDPIVQHMGSCLSPVFFELPGHGKRLDAVSTVDDTLLELADFIAEQQLDNFHLVGHSLGGLIATLFTSKYPEKVQKLILISSATTILIHPDFLRQIKENNLDIPFLKLGFAESMPDELQELVINDLKKIRLAPDVDDFMGVGAYNTREEVRKITQETLIIVGEQDKIVSPRRSKEMSQLVKNNVLKLIPTAKHYPHLETVAETADSIKNFLMDGV